MKIYTKTGDTGTTQVYTKQVMRLSKDDILLENYGNLDELNSHVGMLSAILAKQGSQSLGCVDLDWIQQKLFNIGFALSDEDKLQDDMIAQLESWIDKLTESLPAQTSFILPGGHQAASQAHICRTVTRRCERSMVKLAQQHATNPLALKFINRLSDLFFTFARYQNHINNQEDIKVS